MPTTQRYGKTPSSIQIRHASESKSVQVNAFEIENDNQSLAPRSGADSTRQAQCAALDRRFELVCSSSRSEGMRGVCIPRLDRWLALSAAMMMMGCAGLTYTYAVYSEHMKQRLHFSQEDIDDIGAAKDLGGVVGIFSGIFYDLYPPWVTIGIGAALHLVGYTMVWMTVAGKIAPSFWLLCMYSAVGNGGDNWIDTACMMTSLQNFQDQRGTAMGILKAQLGLSGAIFVMIYEVFLEPDVDRFLLLMTLVPALVYFSLAFLVRPFIGTKDEDLSAARRFKMAFIIVLILGVFMMVSMTWKQYFRESKPFQLVTITVMLSIMLTLYMIPLIRLPRNFVPSSPEGIDLPQLEPKTSNVQDNEEETSNLLTTEADPLDDLKHNQPVTVSLHNITLRDSLIDFNFWLVFIIVTIGAGTGVAIINNLAQIGESLRAGGTDIYVGLISVWSCFGRLGSGYGSDLLMRRGYPRTLCLLIDQIIMALCCLLLATGLVSSLFLGSALTGLSYGAYWTLIPAILSEVFGVQNFTVLYKFVSIGPPIGSYLLSAKVMGYLYDEQALLYRQEKNNAMIDDDSNACYGSKCFRFGLVALSLVSLIGAAASFLLFLGTRATYNRIKQIK